MSNKPLTQNIVEILQWWISKYFKHNVKANLSSLFEKTKNFSESSNKKKSNKFFPFINDEETKKSLIQKPTTKNNAKAHTQN